MSRDVNNIQNMQQEKVGKFIRLNLKNWDF